MYVDKADKTQTLNLYGAVQNLLSLSETQSEFLFKQQ